MPKGPPGDMEQRAFSLFYNEVRNPAEVVLAGEILTIFSQYIVYDVSQIRLRYLLMVKM